MYAVILANDPEGEHQTPIVLYNAGGIDDRGVFENLFDALKCMDTFRLAHPGALYGIVDANDVSDIEFKVEIESRISSKYNDPYSFLDGADGYDEEEDYEEVYETGIPCECSICV